MPKTRQLCLIFGLFVACDGTPEPGGPCASNRDCASTEICVAAECVSIQGNAGQCKNNEDCRPGEVCDLETERCKTQDVIPCESDAQCPAEMLCNTFTNVCIEGERSCRTELDCASIGYRCDLAAQRCRECLENSHCGTGQVCQAGRCEDDGPAQICSMDAECSPPLTICQAGLCGAGCGQLGGLSCGTNEICNRSSGRCTEAPRCTEDRQCDPPNTVCADDGRCALGCAAPGGQICAMNESCNNRTGRCEEVPACTRDTMCNPPASICVDQVCSAGCATTGCPAGQDCNNGTGRCEVTPTSCFSDAQCQPPATICNSVIQACVPGCLTSGCGADSQCNAQSGRCEPVSNGGVLGALCASNTDCDSTVCFDFGPSDGGRCTQSCGISTDCPTGFACMNMGGAKICASASLFANATFDTASGGMCSGPEVCRSGLCSGNTSQCLETCVSDADCTPTTCAWVPIGASDFAAACIGALGAAPTGGTCSLPGDCASGVCISNTCVDLCGSNTDCGSGFACLAVDSSACVAEALGECVEYAPKATKACVSGGWGSGPIDAFCSGPEDCATGICNAVIGRCTATCSRDNDCPAPYRCKAEPISILPDDSVIYTNLCIPESM